MISCRLSTVFFLLVTLLWGCRTEEDAKGPKIFGNLYVRYLQEGQQIKAEASFHKGDSAQHAQPISIPGGVSFQGSGMESRNIQGKLIRYRYENTGDYPGQFLFQVQDEKGEVQQFRTDMSPVSDFIIPDTITRSQGMTIELNPAPAREKEGLAILFTDSTGKAYLIEVPAPLSQKTTISPARFNQFVPGPYQVYLVKKKKEFFQEGHYRVYLDVEFYTGVKKLVIGD